MTLTTARPTLTNGAMLLWMGLSVSRFCCRHNNIKLVVGGAHALLPHRQQWRSRIHVPRTHNYLACECTSLLCTGRFLSSTSSADDTTTDCAADNNNNTANNENEEKVSLPMENLYQEWTMEQDQVLWEHRDESTVALACRLGRGLRGVQKRLAKLRDVDSKAYERLFSDEQQQQQSTTTRVSGQNSYEEEDGSRNKHKKLIPASEVLRRIQWDPCLSSSCNDFVVLHYDRVQDEVMESPFDAPNTNIAGQATRLVDALPEHRIVGIKYKERVVWDRHERLDLVFSGPGIENIIAGYEEWKQKRDAVREFNRQRQLEVSGLIQQMLGMERFDVFKGLSRELQEQGEGMSLMTNIEGYVQNVLDLFRQMRNDPTGSLNPALIPRSDFDALDQFSELVALLPDSKLRPLILTEISRCMQRIQGKKKSSPLAIQELPDLNETDLSETFVRGSGPGGQKVNKTSNRVVLVHNPTGVRVECQETRSLPQNRKIARKRLRLKLDDYLNGSHSRNNVKAQKAASKKNRTKAKNRARQRQKQKQAANQSSNDL